MFGTAEMLDKFTKLKKEIDVQRSIIFSLSYRYLLEKLPPEGQENATGKWKKFWDAIWNGGEPRNEELRKLVEKYRDKTLINEDRTPEDNGTNLKGKRKKKSKDRYLSNLNEVARALYKTLSTNFHHYA
jgi:hypothetical protein